MSLRVVIILALVVFGVALCPRLDRAAPLASGPDSALAVPLEKQSPVRIGTVVGEPVIDGKLDEDVWKSATVLKDFVQIQPGDNIEPTQKTEILITHDAKHLYMGCSAGGWLPSEPADRPQSAERRKASPARWQNPPKPDRRRRLPARTG